MRIRTKLTPPQIAREWGIDVAKVLGWIRSGELVAIDAAAKRGGRPRFLIDRADLRAFEESRRVVQGAKPNRRRRRIAETGVIQFYQ